MQQTITIGPGTQLDLHDLLQSRLLIQGNSGAGKSGVARTIIEGCFGQIPFVVWDIEGEYFTLKELSPDIIIIGGLHADVKITMALATELPKFIIANRLNCVVDLSDLRMSERIHFTKLFFETLMDLPMQYWVGYLFFLEECHKLAGEQDKQDSATAIKDLMQRGRKRGFCGIPITQRISMLNKSVAAECNNKFIGRTNLDLDMDRSARELGFSKSADRLKLRDLKQGHFYAYGTSIDPQHVHVIKVNKPKTTMPKGGVNLDYTPPKPTSKIVKMLEKLTAGSNEPIAVTPTTKGSATISVQPDRQQQLIIALQNQLAESERCKDQYAKLAVERQVLITKIAELIQDSRLMENSPTAADTFTNLAKQSTGNVPLPSIKKQYPLHQEYSPQHPEKQNGLPEGERAILTACYQFSGGLTRSELRILTGYKRSSVDAFIQRLKQKGYLEIYGNAIQCHPDIFSYSPDKIKLRETLIGDNPELPVGEQLREHWLNKLPEGESKILKLIIWGYPESVSKKTIDDATEYKRSSRDAFIQRLKSKDLITVSGQLLKAADMLFLKHK